MPVRACRRPTKRFVPSSPGRAPRNLFLSQQIINNSQAPCYRNRIPFEFHPGRLLDGVEKKQNWRKLFSAASDPNEKLRKKSFPEEKAPERGGNREMNERTQISFLFFFPLLWKYLKPDIKYSLLKTWIFYRSAGCILLRKAVKVEGKLSSESPPAERFHGWGEGRSQLLVTACASNGFPRMKQRWFPQFKSSLFIPT